MDWIQLHLALNHVPVVGVPLVIVMLAAGWALRWTQVVRFSLWSLVVLAVLAIAIKFTGDFAAEQSVQELAQLRDFVSRHEESGDQATTAVFLLGIASGVTLFMARRGKPVSNVMLAVVLLLGISAAVLYARSAHSGGLISHPELRAAEK